MNQTFYKSWIAVWLRFYGQKRQVYTILNEARMLSLPEWKKFNVINFPQVFPKTPWEMVLNYGFSFDLLPACWAFSTEVVNQSCWVGTHCVGPMLATMVILFMSSLCQYEWLIAEADWGLLSQVILLNYWVTLL